MLTCEGCGAGRNPGEHFERREYVRQQTIVGRHDEPATPDGPIVGDPLGTERTY